jgi:hypothetical protein
MQARGGFLTMSDSNGSTNKTGCLAWIAGVLACLTAAFAFGDQLLDIGAEKQDPVSETIQHVRETNENLVGGDDFVITSDLLNRPPNSVNGDSIAEESFIPEYSTDPVTGEVSIVGYFSFEPPCDGYILTVFNNTKETVVFDLGYYQSSSDGQVALGPKERWKSAPLSADEYILIDADGRWGYGFTVEDC